MVIAYVSPPVELVITHFADQVKIELISHFISDILKALQKLYKYFHGTSIATSFPLPCVAVFLLSFWWILMIQHLLQAYLFNIGKNIHIFSNTYHYTLLSYTSISQHHDFFALST